jgi:type I restriction-modification system DNA methylase subunit
MLSVAEAPTEEVVVSNTIYVCKICDHKSSQKSHHKTHINSKSHKLKKKIFKLKLEKLSSEELKEKYGNDNIEEIIKMFEKEKIKPKPKNETSNVSNSGADSNIITNKEALKSKIHEIHNYLRNNGGGYGMNALKVFNILYGMKKLEQKDLLDEVCPDFPEELKFSNLLREDDNKRIEVRIDALLTKLHTSKLKYMLFYEIPTEISGGVYKYLFNEIEELFKLETTEFQLSGKIYEYFIGRDATAISELGAYFTDRYITKFIYDEEGIILNDDLVVPCMIDPFGGSGGFTTGYIMYLQEKYPNINWNNELCKINHFDMNEDVIKSSMLEFFCLTGNIPGKTNVGYKNSFKDEFANKKYKRIYTNPPYGGDDNKKTQEQSKRCKIKTYLTKKLESEKNEESVKRIQTQLKDIDKKEKVDKKNKEKSKVTLLNDSTSDRIRLFAKKYGLKGTDKESVSLIQLMDLVDIDGTVVGVLKEGVFFNKTYKGIRECLIKNFNVRKVISIPSDQFENTSTKTSVLVFDNTEEKTSVIEFSEIIVEKFSEDKFEEIDGQIVCTEYSGEGSKLKPDIKSVEKKLVSTATAEEILTNDTISFNGKDYIKDEIVPGEGYELKRLGDVCKLYPTTKHTTSIGKKEGMYRFYNSSQNMKLYVDFCEINNLSVIIGQGGNFSIHLDNNFTPSKHVCVLMNKNNTITRYVYFNIIILKNNFQSNGSTISWLNKTNIKKFMLSIPKSPEKIQYWVDRISAPFNEKNEKQTLLENLEQEVLDRVKFISENEDCENVELGYVCEINYGTRITKTGNITGEIPVYGGGDITFYTNKSNRDKETLIVSRYALSKCCVRCINNKFYLNDSGMSIHSNEKSLQKYINYFLMCKSTQAIIYNNCTSGSVQRNLNMNLFKKIKLNIPKNKNLITKLEPKFAQVEQLKLDIQNAETRFEQYIQELGNDAIKK